MIKWIFLAFTLLMIEPPLSRFNDIARSNAQIRAAKDALDKGDYENAIRSYRRLIDSLGMDDSQLKLNLAHALHKNNQSEEAVKAYQELSLSNNLNHRSIASQQLGNIASANKDYQSAIQHYKSALKANPANEEARYNFELAKRLLDKQKEENPDSDNQEEKEQENQDQQKDNQQGEGEKEEKEREKGEENEETGEEQQQKGEAEKQTEKMNENPEQQEARPEDQRMEQMQNLKERLEEMKMNEETAMMILEALRNQEVQYLQQMRRKATQNRKSGKPDW